MSAISDVPSQICSAYLALECNLEVYAIARHVGITNRFVFVFKENNLKFVFEHLN